MQSYPECTENTKKPLIYPSGYLTHLFPVPILHKYFAHIPNFHKTNTAFPAAVTLHFDSLGRLEQEGNMIREATFSDAEAIADIYNYYILNTIITFELDPVTPQEIASRMEKYKQIGPYLVYEDDKEVIGYAYVSKFRERPAYQHSVESTIYFKNGCGGKGWGTRLYSELLSQVSTQYHIIVAGVALPNEASVRLHERCGFKKVAHFWEVGRKFDKWIDVGFWQKEGHR